MTKLVELDQNEVEVTEEESLVNPAEDHIEEEIVEEETQEAKQKIPAKFQGKSLEDVVTAYSELEKELGRKGNEIGELRKLTDQLLELEIQQKKRAIQQTEVKEDDLTADAWFEAPDKATEKFIERSPLKRELEEIKQRLASQDREAAQQAFEVKHSDYREIGSDPDFASWIQSSKYRLDLAKKADAFDFEAADELFSLYKEIRGAKAQEQKAATQERVEKERKKASLESTSKAGGAKKVYRRADLIRLKMNDPDRYMQMQDEIMQAYSEGRVR